MLTTGLFLCRALLVRWLSVGLLLYLSHIQFYSWVNMSCVDMPQYDLAENCTGQKIVHTSLVIPWTEFFIPCFEIRHHVACTKHTQHHHPHFFTNTISSLSSITSSSWAPKLSFIDPCFWDQTLHTRLAQYQRQSEDIKVAFMITFETVTLCSWLVYAVYVSCCVQSRQRLIAGRFVGRLALVTFSIKREEVVAMVLVTLRGEKGACTWFSEIGRDDLVWPTQSIVVWLFVIYGTAMERGWHSKILEQRPNADESSLGW